MWCSWPILLPLLASGVDFVVGDPWGWLHPVQVMGWFIKHYEQAVFRQQRSPLAQRLLGVGLGMGLPLLSGAIAIALTLLATRLHPLIGFGVATVALASCLAGRSLRFAAEDVLRPLTKNDLEQARQQLRLYVGRDTQQLSAAEILRAVMETVSENATDGVMAPLLYALLGTAIAPFLGVGLAIAYKAVSTLDSMIGYRAAPYTDFGWFSARLEDVLTWLPCRLTVLTVALLSGHPQYVWQTCRRDAPADPSPNAGWSECAYAAALGIQLGGINYYSGAMKVKPLLAEARRPITPLVVRRGLRLTRNACLLWLLIGTGGLWIRYRLNC